MRTWPHRAHRFSAVLAGKLSKEKPVIAHTCDNPSCVNPDHLFAATNAENSADMVKKGRQGRGQKQHLAKLDEKKVLEIRQLRSSGVGIAQIAKIYGVDHTNISYIALRKTWKHI